MKPALSVVLFTVLSGAGLGALALLALLEIAFAAGLANPPEYAPLLARAGTGALVLLAAGLASSTLHLANPRNAWRSLARVRTSWLSREAAAALLLLPVATAFVAALAWDGPSVLLVALALATLLLSWATLACTAMIYASLRPIRQWHTARVPLVFAALAHASGALAIVALVRAYGEPAPLLALAAVVLLVAAALAKLDYFAWVASGERAVTMAQAIGVAHGVRPPRTAEHGTGGRSVMATRLLDAGHSRGTFLTHEFGFTLPLPQRRVLRLVLWIGAFAVPLAWLALGLPDWRGSAIALAACMIGLAAERWLFFAEARHTVRLYHGDATT